MQRACQACGKAFTAARTTAKFCSDACRQRVHRGTVVPLADRTPRPAPLAPGRLQEATGAALEAAGVESTPLGFGALLLAESIESPDTPPAAKASLMREFRATLTEATAGARRGTSVDDLKDELARRRAARH